MLRCRMDIDERLDDFDRRLRAVEARLGIQPVVDHQPEAPAASTFDLFLIGKSILILGGAFLLRAATESAAVPPRIGVLVGFLYALAWIGWAMYDERQGRRLPGVFAAATAAVVAYPIVWEAATRFHVLSGIVAAIVVAILSIALIAGARVYDAPAFAWIAAAGATLDALLLAYATKNVIPFLLELAIVAAAAFLFDETFAGWLLAIESDLVAILLIVMTLLAATHDARAAVAGSLLVFAALWIAVGKRAVVQCAIATLIGIAGASYFALAPAPRAIVWSVATLVAAEIARRAGVAFTVQSAIWALLAATGGGLYAAAFSLAAFFRKRNVVLLAAATYGALAAIGSVPVLVMTLILAAAAVALALIGRVWRVVEASQLAIVLLVLTGAKVIYDLRAGSAAMIFIALGVYGTAMLAFARITSSANG